MSVVVRVLAALLFLSFVIGQAPHTVHHLFEPEHADTECPFASAGERLPGLDVANIGFDHGLAAAPAEHLGAPPRLPGIVVRGPLARAPPSLASVSA